jgi:hypothetical protein
MSRFEFDYQTSYPPVLIDKKTGEQCVIISQTEVFLTKMLIELDGRVLGKKVFASQSGKNML